MRKLGATIPSWPWKRARQLPRLASSTSFLMKQALLLLQGGAANPAPRVVHAGRSGGTARTVIATGKACWNGFFVKQSLLPLQGGVAHAGRFGIVIATGKACLKNFFVKQSLQPLQGGVSHVGRSFCTARTAHAGRSGRTTRIVTATGKASLDILHTVFVRRCCRSAPTRWPWSLQCRGWPCRWTGFRCRRHGKQV